MPELPEVETTRRGIEPLLQGRRVSAVLVHQPRLRWPVPTELAERLPGQPLLAVERRAKYLLLRFPKGTLILHLGMSGSLRVVSGEQPRAPHDHLELAFGDQHLRLRDPRRFGAALWTEGPPLEHPLLRHLGPEPLSDAFDGTWLHRRARNRRLAVKNLLMDQRIVVGVGNIYANEALFMAGIQPARPAGGIAARRYHALAEAVKEVLRQAIEAGGTTLQDFRRADGRPGYFAQALNVYGRAGEPCPRCGRPVRRITLGQRSTYFCPRCQC